MFKALEQALNQGPISVAQYMELCLYDPDHGYYTTHNPLGAEGDFTTAPEITPLFGKLLARWVADAWFKLGQPTKFNLIELGPGRGTLMADMLTTLHGADTRIYDAARPHMVETSPALTKLQQKNLLPHKAEWHTTINGIDFSTPSVVIGNEFLDAFPVEHYIYSRGQWRQRMVAMENGRLCFVEGAVATPPLAPEEPKDGDIYEYSPGAMTYLEQLKGKLEKGYGLFLDYGYTEGHGDTLQAVKGHKKVDVFTQPGTADLTAHVNFDHVRHIWGDHTSHPTDMGVFLLNLGLAEVAMPLLEKLPDDQRAQAESALTRLIHPSQMGKLFKAISIHTNGLESAAAVQLPLSNHQKAG